ncbi:MAG: hypothetical protein RLY93_19545 [Sumerlaeia bacterium]
MLRICAVLLFTLFSLPLWAAEATVKLSPSLEIEMAGRTLRSTLNAWKDAGASALPVEWEPVALRQGQNLQLATGAFLVMLEGTAEQARVLAVDADGGDTVELKLGEEASAGPLRMIYTGAPSAVRPYGEFLIRAKEEPKRFADNKKRPGETTRIVPLPEEHGFTISGSDPDAVAFAENFLWQLNAGKSAQDAAEAAWAEFPPKRAASLARTAGAPQAPAHREPSLYRDPVNAFGTEGLPDDLPFAAKVTLTLVRGEEQALKELSSAVAYDSAGRATDRPRVRASGGGEGAEVEIGEPGDRFRGKLRALEANKQVEINGETFVHVPLGGEASFRFNGPNGGVDGILFAKRSGAESVVLEVDQEGGDWSFLGAVRTQARLRQGQTIQLAKNTSTRTERQESQAPILGGIPYVGPLFGNERTTTDNRSYVLFATMEFDS